MKTNNTFSKNIKAFTDPNIRQVINQGGTSSGKTYSVLQQYILYAIKNKKKEIISIVAESVPHLKRGALRDFINILQEEEIYKESDHNKTNLIYTLNNKQFEFFSADSADKLRGGRRDHLFINECNNVSYDAYTQLAIRTRKKIILDYNPSHEFWVYTQGLIDDPKSQFIKTTYKDNHLLEPAIIEEIEKRRITNPEWYKVYGLGELGSLEGTVYKNWHITNEFPEHMNKYAGFIDFGFTNDPCAVGVAGIYNSELFTKEIIYERGLTNQMLAKKIIELGYRNVHFVADCAEPKSIEELRALGLHVTACTKGAGSIEYGIGLLKDFRVNVFNKSLNAIIELRNYIYDKDKKTDKLKNKPVDDFNHFLDGLRYYAMDYLDKTAGVTFGNFF